VGRTVAVAALLLWLLAAGQARPASPGEPFFIGFAEDLPKEIGSAAVAPAVELGGSAFRLTTLWTPGQTAIPASEATKLDRATAAAGAQRLVLAVYAASGADAPQTAAARDAYCAYVSTLLGRYPAIRDVVIWNEPNKRLFWNPQAGAPAAYEALLARCYALLPAHVNVIGLALSSTGNDDAGSTSPGAFIRGVGDAYRANGRTGRILDTVAHHPYGLDAAERPWRRHIAAKPIGMGDWNKLMFNLFRAFDGTAQPIPGEEDVRLWYTEVGFQTAIDAGRPGYSGTENAAVVPDFAGGEPDSPAPADTSAAPDQATQALDAVRLAACQPYVTAYFNFLLADEPVLGGWQSGLLWVDRTRKDSWALFRQAATATTTNAVDCGALKGGRPSADFLPPSTPVGIAGAGAAEPMRVELTWNAATDDASAISYRVFRNGAHVGTTSATSWTNTSVAPSTTYTYTVRALDAAGNLGEQSAPLAVTTPAEPAPPAPSPEPPPSAGGGGGGGALPPDLSLSIAAGPSPPRAGEPLDLVLTVANDPASGMALGVSATIELPAGSSLLAPVSYERGAGCTGAVAITCFLDFLPGGWSTPLRLRVAPGAGTIAASVSTSTAEPDVADNRAAVDVLPAPVAAPVAQPLRPLPAAPGRLRARVRQGRLLLAWARSPDHARVRAYLVFRDGVLRRRARVLSHAERALRGRHVYTVRAVATDGRMSAARRVVVRR
jgi:hypothetical protein